MDPEPCERCLVVDEDFLVRWSVVRFLETRCREARSAGSGELALALLREWPVDFLITDVRLPGMDGLELASRCRGLRHRPGIILTRESKTPPLPIDLGPLGILGVIEKPFILESLARLLTDILQHPGRAGA